MDAGPETDAGPTMDDVCNRVVAPVTNTSYRLLAAAIRRACAACGTRSRNCPMR